jgi:uncharacterized repeat protein (TIGR03803 family)
MLCGNVGQTTSNSGANFVRLAGAFMAVLAAVSVTASGQPTLQTLTDFNGSDGGGPGWGDSLVLDANGDLFGTTSSGGVNDSGTIFELPAGGTITPLPSSPEGATGLFADSSGNMYGTALGGLYGWDQIFQLTPTGQISTLISFNAPGGVSGNLNSIAVDPTGQTFYGTSFLGGQYRYGSVSVFSANGSPSLIASFNFADGTYPNAGLVVNKSGNIYGTTEYGGIVTSAFPNGAGTVFRVAPDGTVSDLVQFDGTNGGNTLAGLISDKAGDLFGVSQEGGQYGVGDLFEITPDGTFHILTSFDAATGYYPNGGLLLDAAGNLYGTTWTGGSGGDGTVFELATDGTFSLLANFDGANGSMPAESLIADAAGNLYGTTLVGGDLSINNGNGDGTIFEITNSGFVVPEPSSASLIALSCYALVIRRKRKSTRTLNASGKPHLK